MTHIDEGVLRAYYDGELSSTHHERVARHLATCDACTQAAQALTHRATWIAERLAVPESHTVPTSQQAWSRFTARHSLSSEQPLPISEETPMNTSPFWRRVPTAALVGLAATLLIVVTLTVAPLRTFAEDFLQLFRVERVTVLPVDIENVDTSRFESVAERAQLIAGGVEVEEIGESQEVADAAAASAIVGKPVRLPAGVAVDGLHIEAGVTMNGTINEAQLEAVFEMLEQPLDLPSAVDGQPFTVTVPQMVRANLGEGCDAYRHRVQDGCVTLVQLDSPVIEFPDELPVQKFAEVFLQLLGYQSHEARELARSIDWTSTLVVPVPSRGVESQIVSVDGVEGTLLTPNPDAEFASNEYALIWVRDGTLYGLAGTGDPAPGVELANTLR